MFKEYGLDQPDFDSVVLIHEQRVYVKSEAVLQIFKLLGGLIQGLFILRIFPRSFRDSIYDWVARNRYQWFGKREFCMIPAPDLEDRFLE